MSSVTKIEVRQRVMAGGDARPREIARETGTSNSHVYAQLAQGSIKGDRIGKAWVIRNPEARRVLGMNAA